MSSGSHGATAAVGVVGVLPAGFKPRPGTIAAQLADMSPEEVQAMNTASEQLAKEGPQPTDELFSLEEFEQMFEAADEDMLPGRATLEETAIVKAGNAGLRTEDSANQDKAIYGRTMPHAGKVSVSSRLCEALFLVGLLDSSCVEVCVRVYVRVCELRSNN